MDASQKGRARPAVFCFGAATAWSAGNVGPVTTEIAAEFSIGLAVVGLISGTIFFAGLVAGKSVVTRLSGRVGVDRSARLACLSSGLGNLMIAVSPILAGLYAGRLISGIGLGMALVFGPAIARQLGGVSEMGVFGAGVTLGIAGALGLGSLLAEAGLDWRWGFAISALIGLVPLSMLPRRSGVPAPDAAARGFGRRALHRLAGWRLLLLFTAVLGIPYALGAWLVHYLTQVETIDAGIAGVLAFASYGLLALFRELGARIARPARVVALTGFASFAGAAGLLLLAGGEAALALPAVILIGVGFGLPYATMYEEAGRSFPDDPVAAIAFFTMGGNVLPLVVVPLVGSALSHGNGELAFALLGALIALAGLASMRPAVRL